MTDIIVCQFNLTKESKTFTSLTLLNLKEEAQLCLSSCFAYFV